MKKPLLAILGTVMAAGLLVGGGIPAASASTAKDTYQKYSWSPTIYKVTNGKPTALSYDAWRNAGFPKPSIAKAPIPGSYIWKWGTNDDLGIIEPNGKYHWLTYSQWKGMGFPGITQNRSNEGFVKLSWDNSIARMSDLKNGKGAPIGWSTWKNENFPKPQVKNRFPGDQVYKYSNSNTVWYAGPTVNRAINYNEWRAMGFPAPKVIQAGGGGNSAPNTAEGRIQRDLGTWGCGNVNVKFKSGIPGGQAEPWTNTIYLRSDIKAQSYNYILSHECGHMKQYWAYGSTLEGWMQMQDDMNRIYGGTDYSGLDQNADCISNLTGNNNIGYYTFNCSGARNTAAQAINNGRRP